MTAVVWRSINRPSASEPQAELGGGNGDCRVDNLTSAAGGEEILDSHAVAVAETDSESGPWRGRRRGRRLVNATQAAPKKRTKPTTATQKRSGSKVCCFNWTGRSWCSLLERLLNRVCSGGRSGVAGLLELPATTVR